LGNLEDLDEDKCPLTMRGLENIMSHEL